MFCTTAPRSFPTSASPATRLQSRRRAAAQGSGGQSGFGAKPGIGSGARPAIDPKDPMRDLKTLILAQPLAEAMDVGDMPAASVISEYYSA